MVVHGGKQKTRDVWSGVLTITLVFFLAYYYSPLKCSIDVITTPLSWLSEEQKTDGDHSRWAKEPLSVKIKEGRQVPLVHQHRKQHLLVVVSNTNSQRDSVISVPFLFDRSTVIPYNICDRY